MRNLIVTLSILTGVYQAALARPSISSGVSPHPGLVTMRLEKPQAGIDFPTDGGITDAKAILVLDGGKRIQIKESAMLKQAKAGVDFPTDSKAPMWAQFQKVLVLESKSRIPVRLGLENGDLTWKLPNGNKVSVNRIVAIQRSAAGIDFPTDVASNLTEVLVLDDGSREPVQ